LLDLTQFFSLQQKRCFSGVRLSQTVIFAKLTKSYMSEMTRLLKPSQRTTRKELRQKRCIFLFLGQPEFEKNGFQLLGKFM